MIFTSSTIRITDSSGARFAECIKVLRKSPRGQAKVGDFIIATIKIITPKKKVKKGEIHKILVIRTANFLRRPNGIFLRFSIPCGIIVDKKTNLPKAKRIFGPVPKELRLRGHVKVVSLATIAL